MQVGVKIHSSHLPAYEVGTDSVPKRRHIDFRRQGITQKKAYNFQNKAKVWNQEHCKVAFPSRTVGNILKYEGNSISKLQIVI